MAENRDLKYFNNNKGLYDNKVLCARKYIIFFVNTVVIMRALDDLTLRSVADLEILGSCFISVSNVMSGVAVLK